MLKLWIFNGKWFPTETQAKTYSKRLKVYGDIISVDCGMEVVSVTQVSIFYNIPRNTVLNWIKSGNIKAFRIGTKWMLSVSDLPAWK